MKIFVASVCFCFFFSGTIAELDKALGETCENNADCSIAYSFCSSNNKCVCADGFETKDLQCKSQVRNCPPIIRGTSKERTTAGQNCNITRDRYWQPLQDSCPGGFFCLPHPKTSMSENNNVGHCCPEPPTGAELGLVCPLSTINTSGTCPDVSGHPADLETPPELTRTCPYYSHDCYRLPKFRRDEVCCPLPCRGASSHFAVDGKCYDTKLIGQTCEHTSQCGGGSKCKSGPEHGEKTCQCDGQTIQEPTQHCI